MVMVMPVEHQVFNILRPLIGPLIASFNSSFEITTPESFRLHRLQRSYSRLYRHPTRRSVSLR